MAVNNSVNTVNIAALAANRWLIESDAIVCDRGRRTTIRVFGGTGDLVLWSEALPDELESWLRSRPWADELRNRGVGLAFTFGPDRLSEIAKMAGARQASRRVSA